MFSKKYFSFQLLLFCLFISSCQKKSAIDHIREKEGLIALWDFDELAGSPRLAVGEADFPLVEMNGPVMRVAEGPLSGHAAEFKNEVYLSIPNSETGSLNISGKNQGVTVIAWVKWEGKTGFVGGMWNEYTEGGKRQYGLFVDLPHYNGAEQVGGHISFTGGPTTPFPYSCDYSASLQKLKKGKWHFIAFNYDGEYIRSFLDGVFEEREPEPIKNTVGFEGLPEGLVHSKNPYYFPDGIGDNGSDFTVGAVVLSRGMGNHFNGLIGGLAVFNRVLEDREIFEINEITMASMNTSN